MRPAAALHSIGRAMGGEEVVIVGTIRLDSAVDLDGAVAEIRLIDATLADAPSRTIARELRSCSGRSVGEIPFRLRARPEPGRQYRVSAEIRRKGGEALEPGDLASTRSHPWRPDSNEPVEVAVGPIS